MNYNSSGFNELVKRRPKYLLKLLRQHQKIIYSDIDTIWLKDPRPYLSGNFDFWAQIDGVISGLPYVEGYIPFFCTGFLALQGMFLSYQMSFLNLIIRFKFYCCSLQLLEK